MRRASFVVLLALGTASCFRSQKVWSGLDLSKDQKVGFLVAEQPSCGCISLANISGQELRLIGNFKAIVTGEARLLPEERLRFKFDWASSEIEEYYELRAYDTDGNLVELPKAIRVEGIDPWRGCEKAACTYDPLQFSLGESSRED